MNGKLYTICRAEPETAREGEKAVCAATRRPAKRCGRTASTSGCRRARTRVGWLVVVGDPASGNIYVLGVCGYFACIEADGRPAAACRFTRRSAC